MLFERGFRIATQSFVSIISLAHRVDAYSRLLARWSEFDLSHSAAKRLMDYDGAPLR